MTPTSARLCASCGSPLPEVAAGVHQVKCEFCGVVNDIAAAGPAPVTIAIDTANATRVASRIGGIVATVVVISVVAALAAAGLGIYVAMRSVSEVTRTVSSSTSTLRSVATAVTRRSIAPADLPRGGGGGWQTLDVAPPSSGWPTFEPVTDLGWATTVAKAWQPDARLTRIDVSRLTPQGTVNLESGADDSAGYRFESPSQIEEWTRSARRGDSNPEVGYELMVKLAQRTVTALVVKGKPSAHDRLPTTPVDSLPLEQLLSTARRTPAFAQASFYDGYMIYNEREGWVWYLTGRGFDESLPRLRARDGAAYPFR